MVGYVSEAVAKALREWKPLKDAKIFPVRAPGNGMLIDTPIPTIAIEINSIDGEGNVYLSGGIRQYFELVLHVVMPINNYSFTPDNNAQADMLDVSDEVIVCMENTHVMDDVKVKHDLDMQFDREDTETTYGTQGAVSVAVEVHRIIYNCSVEFNSKRDEYNKYGVLERVEIDNNGVNKSIIE